MTIFDFKPRSDAAVVRNLLPEIEAAQQSGASRESLWQNLRDHHALNLSFDAFCVALKRARAKQKEKASATVSALGLALPDEKTVRHRENAPESIDEPQHQHPFSTRATEQTSARSPRKNRIKTTGDFADVHKLDFNEFDDKFK
ncbi:hypothetical protein [Caballeronia telluris]|uniref:hypothetical protein n=1 Tax=Caballeronia telluris TaxID=326475 RepID=UPI000B3E68DE|nr:hypothetical protein [Caballeronia telluris]